MTTETQTSTEFNLDLLLQLTAKLTATVNNETQFLREMKISEIQKLQDDKNDIAIQLERQQNLLRNNAEARANLTEEHKAALKAVATNFDEAIGTYQEELFKARKVNELVINKMLEIVKEHVTKNRSYNRAGSKDISGRELLKNTPALKINAQV